MNGWLLVLSFLLGFVLTCVYMIRTVTRTVTPIPSRESHTGHVSVHSRVAAPRGGATRGGTDRRSRSAVVELEPEEDDAVRRRHVEFDDGDVYER